MKRLCIGTALSLGTLMWVALFPALAYAQSVELSSPAPVQVSTGWRVAEVEGRLLWVSEQKVSLRADARTRAQLGWQKLVAKGKVRTNRFSTSARWFELERLLQDERDQQTALLFRRTEAAEGVADVAEGLFTYVAPRIDTAAFVTLQRSRRWERSYRLSYSRIRAGTEAADTLGVLLSARPLRRSGWQLEVEGGIFADRKGDTTYRVVFGGWMGADIGQGVRVHLGVTFAPRGLPYGGTSLEALTAFALYEPGSLVQSWRDRPAGYLTLQVTAGR